MFVKRRGDAGIEQVNKAWDSTVYAVVATELFMTLDPPNFGTFSRSLFSLFQVSTGDSWASVITRVTDQ